MSSSGRRWNRILTGICATLILIDLLTIVLGLASIPRYLERIETLTIPPYGTGIGNVLTNANVMEQAEARGMTLTGFAWYLLAVQFAAAVIFTGVGVLVLWRARAHWFGWFTAHVMLFLNSYAFYQPTQVALLVPTFVIDMGSVLWPTFLLYLFLFPNGKVVPRWMRWPIVVYTITHASFQLLGTFIVGGVLPPGHFNVILARFEFGILGIFGLVLGAQIYRYARVSSSVEKAQTRWFILGIVIMVGLPGLASMFGFGRFFDTLEWGTLSLVIFPITLAIAILRFRLWDIDVIIRKTLQYTVLTGLLASVYFGGVILLQAVLEPVFRTTDSALATVVTTLAIAALFNPLRGRVQEFIDHRFYRVRYSAERALDAFARSVRGEVDLEQLAGSIFMVVEDTVQPTSASLWLSR